MSNIPWCDIGNNNFLRLHDYCPNPICTCQKQITFTPKQFQLEEAGFKNTMKKTFKGSQTAWIKFLKPALYIASPYIGRAVPAQTNNPHICKVKSDIIKNISGGRKLSLTDMHCRGLGLKKM